MDSNNTNDLKFKELNLSKYKYFTILIDYVLLKLVDIYSIKNLELITIHRLNFLKDTIQKIVKFISQFKRELEEFEPLVYFIEIISNYLKDLLEILILIETDNSLFTSNFDIFEFKLRESLNEIETLFQLNEEQHCNKNDSLLEFISPVVVIKNNKLKEYWIINFGFDKYTITFKNFIKMLENCFFKEKQIPKDTILQLKYLTNFPENAEISTFKVNQIVQIFGEEQDLVKNLKYIESKGFLGLINRIQSFEFLIENHVPNNTLLIRFSRTFPNFFAITYKNKDGKIKNMLNKNKLTGEIIPIKEFINTNFNLYELINLKVDYKEIFSKNNLNEYALNSSGYIH
jgi:hypothetical protein